MDGLLENGAWFFCFSMKCRLAIRFFFIDFLFSSIFWFISLESVVEVFAALNSTILLKPGDMVDKSLMRLCCRAMTFYRFWRHTLGRCSLVSCMAPAVIVVAAISIPKGARLVQDLCKAAQSAVTRLVWCTRVFSWWLRTVLHLSVIEILILVIILRTVFFI